MIDVEDVDHLSDADRLRRLTLLKKLKDLETKKSNFRTCLPHLFLHKFYPWSRRFFKSKNRLNFLCAANQIGKSTTNIRKAIEWATNVKLWPELWPGRSPKMFWYIYPSAEVATVEWETKWKDLMPKGDYQRSHPLYGWRAQLGAKKEIKHITFNSGITIYFRYHTQSAQNLQAATVDAVFADEEMPEHLYSEISFRLAASRGYFHMVFTATLGQEIWRKTMEPREDEEPMFPEALKIHASLYDCKNYDDGTPSHWTDERIAEIEANCKSDTERRRRVLGRFVSEEGRLYSAYEPEVNRREPFDLNKPPAGWNVYAGVDPGSGGETGHPAAISFVAVSPDYKKGVVFRCWRGSKEERTTSGDVFEKYLELSKDLKVVDRRYDWAARDFATISERAGITFNKADKDRSIGVDKVNTLFKSRMLSLVWGDPEVDKLSSELLNVRAMATSKDRKNDDLCDATRYAVNAVPWNWEGLNFIEEDRKREAAFELKRMPTEQELIAQEIERRRGQFAKSKSGEEEPWQQEYDEIEFWNSFG